MLKVGGENVAAMEIEAYLQTHPAVKIAQVVGVPDPKYVEVAAAFVELKDGAAATEDELIAFCQGQIASFKVPRIRPLRRADGRCRRARSRSSGCARDCSPTSGLATCVRVLAVR